MATSTEPMLGSPPPPPLLDPPARAVEGCTRETTTYAAPTRLPPATPLPMLMITLTTKSLQKVSALLIFNKEVAF